MILRKVFDRVIMPFVISLLLVKIMVDEYRDNGWVGVVLMMIAAVILAVAIFGGLMYWISRSITGRQRNDPEG